jgi:hypothetical protein
MRRRREREREESGHLSHCNGQHGGEGREVSRGEDR